MAYLWSTVLVLLLDQLSKGVVLGTLEAFQVVPVVPAWFNLTLLFNTGGAFGILQGQGIWLAWVATCVSAGIVVMLIRFPRPNPWVNLGLSFIAGGALGNLLDRTLSAAWHLGELVGDPAGYADFSGAVVDFLQVCFNGACGFPVFNLADSAVFVGTAVILLAWSRRDPEPEPAPEATEPSDVHRL